MAKLNLTKPNPRWVTFLQKHRAMLIPAAFMAALTVVLVPLPPFVLDVLICLNIAASVIILMTTMEIDEPLDLSVFPSLLLAATLFRLVLNVATTRLILTADATSPEEAAYVAGKVVSAFGSFVAGGSLAVGVIIFLILVIVQFVVVTKGATRISEVAARFTLDAMPGKQMAIDADLNAGVINEAEARSRRERIAQEADFFGAMDGASKFVRGDAVAGIVITIINVIGGFAVGAMIKDWPVADTARAFTILTIGDGIASQIPAFLVAIASALIVTRSGSKSNLGTELTAQLASRPAALFMTSGFLAALTITPLPTMPLMLLAGSLAVIGFFALKQGRMTTAAQEREKAEAETKAAPAPSVEDVLKVDTLELEIGYGLVSLVDANQGGNLLERISAIRRQLAAETGLVMPPVRIRDNMTLPPSLYRVKVRGNVVAEGESRPDMLLAMDSGITTGSIQGEETREPAFGLPAYWIVPPLRTRAEALNYTVVDPTSVLTTHLAEVVKAHADELLTRDEVNNLIAQLQQQSPKLVEEVVPVIVKPGELQKILQALLRERVPVRDLGTILETLGDWAPKTKDPDVLVEYVRNALRRSICQQYSVPVEPEAASMHAAGLSVGVSGGKGARLRLVCVTLDPSFEDLVNGYIDRSAAGTTLTMPASVASVLARRVVQALGAVTKAGHHPVVIASPQVRATVRQLLEPYVPNVAVLGYNEIVPGIDVESLGLVTSPEEGSGHLSTTAATAVA